MRLKIFNTFEIDPVDVNKFLAQDGKTISVERIHTAACNGGYGSSHFITVEYRTLEQSPSNPKLCDGYNSCTCGKCLDA